MADASQILDYVEEKTDLDVIAITDHDDIRGAWKTREIWANRRYRFDLVTGIEITSVRGHLLALFVDEPIASLCELDTAIDAIHQQDGLCVIPHPMSWLTRSLNRKSILRIMDGQSNGIFFDAIETATGSAIGDFWVKKARNLNRTHLKLAEAGGSDSHFPVMIGCAYTQFQGRTASDLKRSILDGTTTAVTASRPGVGEIGFGPLVRQTWRGLSTTPRSMGLRRTARSFIKRIFDTK